VSRRGGQHKTEFLRATLRYIDADGTTSMDLTVCDAGAFVEYEDRYGSILARDVQPARQAGARRWRNAESVEYRKVQKG
jgi:hypothetical protein